MNIAIHSLVGKKVLDFIKHGKLKHAHVSYFGNIAKLPCDFVALNFIR